MPSKSRPNRPSSFKPIVLTDALGVTFLRRHPATREVVTRSSDTGLMEAELHFIDNAVSPPQEDWAMPNVNVPGGREADLSFENGGAPPPPGFWITHPDVLAWTTSSIEEDDDGWWVKVWLKGS